MILQEAFYLGTGAQARFCVWRAPRDGALRGTIVHVPPFAEEMNKCRRATAEAARAFAANGFGVLQIDPLGCGDSAGEFGDATWSAWLDDVARATEWATSRASVPLWLWAIRGGALLACDAIARHPGRASVLLWQPVIAGSLHLTQFLRLKLAASMLAENAARAGTRALRDRLAARESIEVAGYDLHPDLAMPLDGARLDCDPAHVARIVWLEIAAADDDALSPASVTCIDRLRSRGIAVNDQAVHGPAIWQTVEIEECPALTDASLRALAQEQHVARDDAVLLRM